MKIKEYRKILTEMPIEEFLEHLMKRNGNFNGMDDMEIGDPFERSKH